jgi:hypothetical protein
MQHPIDPASALARDEARAALLNLPLDTLEEAAGELVRRITVAMRDIGELRADDADDERRTPRQRVASLAALTEAAVQYLGDGSANTATSTTPHPTTVAAVMYGAPTVGGLLQRLEQDRRMLTSVARQLEARLDDVGSGRVLRLTLTEAAIVAPAECARALELLLARWDDEERARFEAELEREGL